MTATDARTGLDRDECLELLAADGVGRLAVVQASTPAVFPVNYVLDGEDIIFRSDPGTKLAAGPKGAGVLRDRHRSTAKRDAVGTVSPQGGSRR